MTLKSDAKFEEKMTCGLKNESVKIGTLMGFFCSK